MIIARQIGAPDNLLAVAIDVAGYGSCCHVCSSRWAATSFQYRNPLRSFARREEVGWEVAQLHNDALRQTQLRQ